ncbi:hypothetical protein BDN67DRAFT_976075 [Paxillus ammoniavirescens]|nr:hypothetical protein BDN67DRAFT_976075 [Paxillus ammoniavirescens]
MHIDASPETRLPRDILRPQTFPTSIDTSNTSNYNSYDLILGTWPCLELVSSSNSSTCVAGPWVTGQRRPTRDQGPCRHKQTTEPAPMIKIRSITDTRQSVFGLLNTHHTRLDHADLGLLVQRDGNHTGEQQQQVEESEGPVPRFPRGVLMFVLSNGHTTFSDIEFRSSQIEVGNHAVGI